MRIFSGTLAVFFLVLLCAPSIAVDGCGHIDTRSGQVGYCIKESNRTANPDVVYYFHGAMPDDAMSPGTTFADGVPELTKYWSKLSLAPPTIIGISWGPSWTLKDARLTSFAAEVIPEIERKLSPPVGRRMVAGISMGGLNAFLAWAQRPELFDGAVFQCPAFPSYNPFAKRPIRLHRVGRVSDGNQMPRVLADIFKRDFRSAAEWARYQPASMMKAIDGKKMPPAYIVYNSRDGFGFGAGSEIAGATRERVNRGHCEDIMTVGVARFLSHRSK